MPAWFPCSTDRVIESGRVGGRGGGARRFSAPAPPPARDQTRRPAAERAGEALGCWRFWPAVGACVAAAGRLPSRSGDTVSSESWALLRSMPESRGVRAGVLFAISGRDLGGHSHAWKQNTGRRTGKAEFSSLPSPLGAHQSRRARSGGWPAPARTAARPSPGSNGRPSVRCCLAPCRRRSTCTRPGVVWEEVVPGCVVRRRSPQHPLVTSRPASAPLTRRATDGSPTNQQEPRPTPLPRTIKKPLQAIGARTLRP